MQCGGAQRHAVALGDRLQTQGPVQELQGRGGVVVRRAGARVGEEAGVEDPADDDAAAASRGGGQQIGQGGLVEEGVAATQSTTSASVSRTKRVSIAVWFMPASMAPITPSARSFSSSG